MEQLLLLTLHNQVHSMKFTILSHQTQLHNSLSNLHIMTKQLMMPCHLLVLMKHHFPIRKLRIWSHLLKKSLTENFIFCAMFLKRCLDFAKKVWVHRKGSMRVNNALDSLNHETLPTWIGYIYMSPPSDPACSEEDSGKEDISQLHNFSKKQLLATCEPEVHHWWQWKSCWWYKRYFHTKLGR